MEGDILRAVQKYGINVDKEELLRALQYDRNQYEKGYDDGKADALKWISVKDRLPENDYGKHWKERPHYLVCLANGLMMVATFGFKEHEWWIDSHSCVLSKEHYREVTHWMPLPEPPKGE